MRELKAYNKKLRHVRHVKCEARTIMKPRKARKKRKTRKKERHKGTQARKACRHVRGVGYERIRGT